MTGQVRSVDPAVLFGALAKRIAASYRLPLAAVISEHEVHFRAVAIPGVFAIEAAVRLQDAEGGMRIRVSGKTAPGIGAYALLALHLAAAGDLFLVPGSGLRSLIPLLLLIPGTAALHRNATQPLSRLAHEVIALYRQPEAPPASPP